MKRIGAPFVLILLCAAATAQEPAHGDDKCDGPVYKNSEVSRRPAITKKPDPGFTEEARRNGVSGTVSLTAVLCHTGRVTDIHVLKGLPDGMTEVSVAAARRIEFTPAEKDGRRVGTHIRLEYHFNTVGDGDDCKDNNKCAGRLVEDLMIEGNRRLTDEEILGHLKTRPGNAYDAEQVERDLQTLLNLSVFDTRQTRVAVGQGARGGVVVRFIVAELPIIRDLTFRGLEGVEEADVLKAWREAGVRVCKECPYDQSQMAAAKAVVRRLLEGRGQSGVTVEAYVAGLSSVSVSLDFVINKWRRFD